LTIVGKRDISLDGQTISYTLKRSMRAKHVRLEVRPETGLIVVIPKSYRPESILDLLKGKRRWILGKLMMFGHVRLPNANKELKSGDTIAYLGQTLEVVTRQSNRNADSIRLEGNKLIVTTRSKNCRLALVVEQWFRTRAEGLIREKVDKIRGHLGVRYNRLTIRGQKTRWGSCSQKGNLSFNWKLIMTPENVIDYVIVHELAHLKEMNHSKKFWQLVAQHCPQWREHKKWLNNHEAEIGATLSA
jgi:predicted metal-dependent hydrolase